MVIKKHDSLIYLYSCCWELASKFLSFVLSLLFNPEQITARISEEIKRMHHHRRRNAVISASPPPAITERTCSPALTQKKEFPASSSLLTSTALQATAGIGCALTSHCRDTPVLSLRQVGLVCERMIKEREDQLREEYDKVLNDKLNG